MTQYFSEIKELALLKKFHSFPLRIFYKGFIPKSIRKNIELNIDRKQQQHISLIWSKIIKDFNENEISDFKITAKKQLNTEKIIWQYWGQGINENIPEIVTICFNSIDQYKEDYSIIRLDDKTIHEYLDIPQAILNKRNNPQFKHAFFADLIRLALLNEYGGIWCDATIYLTDHIPNNIKSANFFMYQRDPKNNNKESWFKYNPKYFSWDQKHKINVLNSFIVSKKYNPLTQHLLNLLLFFWKNENNIPHYFFFQILFNEVIKGDLAQYNNFTLDDTNPHILQRNWKNLDEINFQEIKDISPIHKLTYLNLEVSNLKKLIQ